MHRILCLIFFALSISLKAQDSSSTVIYKDVIISAVKSSEKDPHTNVTISKSAIEKRNVGKDIPMILENQANLITTSDAGTGVGYTGMRIRGSDQTRINITINGIPVNDAESQQVYFVDMPDLASGTSTIQVQRGVGSSTNGGGAFGASVHIQTNEINKKAYGFFNTLAGSFNTWKHTIKGGSGLIKNHFFIEGQLSKISSNGYIERGSSDLWSYHLKTGLVFKKTTFQFIHFGGYEKTYQAWYGVPQDSLATNRKYNVAGTDYGARNPAWPNQVDNYRQHYFQAFLNHTINQKWTIDFAAFTTLGKGYYEEFKSNQRLSKYQLSSPTATRSNIVRRRWLDNVYYGGLWGVAYQTQRIDFKFGGMAAQYKGKHFGKIVNCTACETFDKENKYYTSNGVKTDINIYSKINYSINQKVFIYADLQYRFVNYITKGNNNDLTNFEIQKTWHFFNPKVGIKGFINANNNISLSLAMANKEPARDELIDNKDAVIKPEQLYDAELNYNYKNKILDVSATYYFMYYKDQLLLSGRLNDVGNPIKINTPQSFRTGLELSIGLSLIKSKNKLRNLLRIEGNTSFSINKILNFEDRVPTYDEDYNLLENDYLVTRYKSTNISFSPSWVSGISILSSPFKHFNATLFLKQVSRQYLDNTQAKERSINPYFYGDIQLSYTIPFMKNKSVNLLFNVFNFWNTKYQTNGYTYRERYADGSGGFTQAFDYNNYYPQAGIHFMGGISVNF